jgi:hypothetical protein
MLRVIATALALFFTGAAQADNWKDYENRDYAFTVHFPGDPTVETATYRAADGGGAVEGLAQGEKPGRPAMIRARKREW